MSLAVERAPRKFPPPCWTQDEALALIQAYRERWYALRRGYLRTADWDAVADTIGRECPGVPPPKTSAQCRHKMEKLRQRYRAEKQRAQSFPGRFFSSWFYFEAMDSMENGTDPSNVGNPGAKGLNTPNLNLLPGPTPANPGRGIRFKPVGEPSLVTIASKPKNVEKPSVKSNTNSNYLTYLNVESGGEEDNEEDSDDGLFVENPMNGKSAHLGQRVKDVGKMYHTGLPAFANDGRKQPVYQEPERPRKFGKVDVNSSPNVWDDANGDTWVKVPRGSGFDGKNRGKADSSLKPNGNSRNYGGAGGGGGNKREDGGVAEMVSSIRLLGEGFMKMESMKMDMAREIEKMRMEAEMKRNELILESQKQIVEAFLKGMVETRKKQNPTADAN